MIIIDFIEQALHWAVSGGHGKVIEKLLNNGINATAKTKSEQSAADIALSKGYQKVFIGICSNQFRMVRRLTSNFRSEIFWITLRNEQSNALMMPRKISTIVI